jgi:sugar lactone lactonase YvrE
MPAATSRSLPLALAAAALTSLLLAAGAAALSDCTPQPKVKVLYSGDGVLESVAVDRKGAVYFTDSTAGDLLKLRDGGRPPRVLASGIDGPGGIVFGRPGKVLVGFGDSIAQASDGILSPDAGLYSVDRRTGSRTTFVEGLQMANGIARGDGAIFASSDVGTGIDRVAGGKVELEWATLTSPNGLVADAAGRSLFAAQTFTSPPTVMRIPFDDPGALQPYFSSTAPEDAAAGLDGLTRGDGNTLYVAANGAGQVWRIDGPHSACVLVHRVPFPDGPSNVAFGRGHGIPRSSLLVTTFGGELLQVRKAR